MGGLILGTNTSYKLFCLSCLQQLVKG